MHVLRVVEGETGTSEMRPLLTEVDEELGHIFADEENARSICTRRWLREVGRKTFGLAIGGSERMWKGECDN